MSLKCTTLLCGENIIVDINTKKTTIVNLIEGMSVTPPLAIKINAYTTFEGEINNTHNVEFGIYVNNVLSKTTNVVLNFTKSKYLRNITPFGNIEVENYGLLKIEIKDLESNEIIKTHEIIIIPKENI